MMLFAPGVADMSPLPMCKKASSYIAQYSVLRTVQSAFTLYIPDRPVHSDTISASLGSIQPYAAINARRLLVHISTTVYSQVPSYTSPVPLSSGPTTVQNHFTLPLLFITFLRRFIHITMVGSLSSHTVIYLRWMDGFI